jgi:hypothetical protein
LGQIIHCHSAIIAHCPTSSCHIHRYKAASRDRQKLSELRHSRKAKFDLLRTIEFLDDKHIGVSKSVEKFPVKSVEEFPV